MRILVLQFVPPARGEVLARFDPDLGLAAAMLREDGFELALVPLAGHQPDRLREAINRQRPAYVLVDIPPTAVTAARHTIVDVAERHFLPVAVVGRFVTARTEQAVSIPGVAAAVPGEYEQPMLELFRSVRDGYDTHLGTAAAEGPLAPVPGVWLNSEDGFLRSPPPAPAADLDGLPWPDRELFDYGAIVRATGEASFRASRGCDNWCGYCLNDWYMDLYERREDLLRRRSPENVVEEVAAVTGRYEGARGVAFEDHAFATDADWLEAFAELYPARCELGYRCRVRLDSADDRLAGLLARSGCRRVDVEIGSGSSFIREEVLGIRADGKQIAGGVAALKRAGLHIRASVFVGSPYESEVSVEETLQLLTDLGLRDVRARVYYPVPGTRAADVCAENGWISGRSEAAFHENRSVLDMPPLPAERINEIARRFDGLLRRSRGRSVGAWIGKVRRIARLPLRRSRRKRSR